MSKRHTYLEKLKAKELAYHEVWKKTGGKMTTYTCKFCYEKNPTTVPEGDISKEWMNCFECEGLNYVFVWPNGKTVSHEPDFVIIWPNGKTVSKWLRCKTIE